MLLNTRHIKNLDITMKAATQSVSCESAEYVDPDWIVVQPRRKRRKGPLKSTQPDQVEPQQPWAPPEREIDEARESKLIQSMQTCLKKLETSRFYNLFSNQIQDPEVFSNFSKVLGCESKMNMVIYGIGSIESYEGPRWQLSLAILMKRQFDWIGDIEVFDPVLSATEIKVMESFGCSVMSVNEQGRRQAIKPMLFFMPHCEAVLYQNLLEANWNISQLNNLVLFGNSFEAYELHSSLAKDYVYSAYTKRILAARSFATEFRVEAGADDYCKAFHDTSWLFFGPDPELGLPIV